MTGMHVMKTPPCTAVKDLALQKQGSALNKGPRPNIPTCPQAKPQVGEIEK